MNPNVINPYAKAGARHKESLDYIIANLPPSPTFDDLNDKLTDSFYIPDPQDPSATDLAVPVIKTILPGVYNGYVSSRWGSGGGQQPFNGYWRYDHQQLALLQKILNGIHAIPAESIADFLRRMEEEVAAGALTFEQQTPLLVALQCGISDHEYWMAQLATPGAWAPYLPGNEAIGYLHLAGWVSACMQGTLLGYGLVRPPQVQLLDVLTATIASVGLPAGKVLFNWVSFP